MGWRMIIICFLYFLGLSLWEPKKSQGAELQIYKTKVVTILNPNGVRTSQAQVSPVPFLLKCFIGPWGKIKEMGKHYWVVVKQTPMGSSEMITCPIGTFFTLTEEEVGNLEIIEREGKEREEEVRRGYDIRSAEETAQRNKILNDLMELGIDPGDLDKEVDQ